MPTRNNSFKQLLKISYLIACGNQQFNKTKQNKTKQNKTKHTKDRPNQIKPNDVWYMVEKKMSCKITSIMHVLTFVCHSKSIMYYE
jgi:hypothetical protein